MLYKCFRKNRGERSGKLVENKSHIWITWRYLQTLAAETCRNMLDKRSVWLSAPMFAGAKSQLSIKVVGNVPQHPPVWYFLHQQQWPSAQLVHLRLRRTNGSSFYHIWSLCCLWGKSLKRVMCACVCVCVLCPYVEPFISMLPIVLASVLIAGGKNIWLSTILYIVSLSQRWDDCVLEDCCSFVQTERMFMSFPRSPWVRHSVHWTPDFPCGEWRRCQAPQLAVAGSLWWRRPSGVIYWHVALTCCSHTSINQVSRIRWTKRAVCVTSSLPPDLPTVREGRCVEAHLWRISDRCQLGHGSCSLHQVWGVYTPQAEKAKLDMRE